MPGSIHDQVERPSKYNLSQSTAPDGKGAFLQAASSQTQSPVAKGSVQSHPLNVKPPRIMQLHFTLVLVLPPLKPNMILPRSPLRTQARTPRSQKTPPGGSPCPAAPPPPAPRCGAAGSSAPAPHPAPAAPPAPCHLAPRAHACVSVTLSGAHHAVPSSSALHHLDFSPGSFSLKPGQAGWSTAALPRKRTEHNVMIPSEYLAAGITATCTAELCFCCCGPTSWKESNSLAKVSCHHLKCSFLWKDSINVKRCLISCF
ncbi:translation initiation factor IF-2-like [Cygnus olor]|uniref:translation initiation factor IF-2-like n=1 Tax=Cygnus olor TaxID=8869 RepID=UPI001ADEA4EF|nr:translation initiation factor IF-2-like [Cygnus olor]